MDSLPGMEAVASPTLWKTGCRLTLRWRKPKHGASLCGTVCADIGLCTWKLRQNRDTYPMVCSFFFFLFLHVMQSLTELVQPDMKVFCILALAYKSV